MHFINSQYYMKKYQFKQTCKSLFDIGYIDFALLKQNLILGKRIITITPSLIMKLIILYYICKQTNVYKIMKSKKFAQTKSNSIFEVFSMLLLLIFLSACSGNGNSEISLYPVKSGKDFQYIDKEGKIIINPQFQLASVFRNDLALVSTSGEQSKFGFIDDQGKFVIQANYQQATVFSEDIAFAVIENGAPTAINKKGEIIFTMQNALNVKIFKDGLAAFSISDSTGIKWGFVDKTGKVVINPQFIATDNFSEGKCAVANSEGKWGYIDEEGKIEINYQFNTANKFVNGTAVVSNDSKYGTIDKQGKYKINPQFSYMLNDGDIFLISQDGKFGWCDAEGKIIINPQFSYAFPFLGSELAAVKSGESYGYIDKEGKIEINPQFDNALPFNGKLALVESGNKIGFIDNKGKYAVNPHFDGVSQDLIVYLTTGQSAYESVTSDFFNVGAIISRINVNSPEGLSFSSTVAEIFTKYKKSEGDFNSYTNEFLMLENEKIFEEAYLNFYVLGDFYENVGGGYYGRTVFNPSARSNGFVYQIILKGKGLQKTESIIESIGKGLTGYKKNTENENVYSNGKQTIQLKTHNYGSILVYITEGTPPTAEEKAKMEAAAQAAADSIMQAAEAAMASEGD